MMDLNDLEEQIAFCKEENEKLKKECAEVTRKEKVTLEHMKMLRETKRLKYSVVRELKKQRFLEYISVYNKKREQEKVIYRYNNMASICYTVSSSVINMNLKIDLEKLKNLKSQLQKLKEKFFYVLDRQHEKEKTERIQAYTLLHTENKYLWERLYILQDRLKQKKCEISFLESEKLRYLQTLGDKSYNVQNINLSPHSRISVFERPPTEKQDQFLYKIFKNYERTFEVNDPLILSDELSKISISTVQSKLQSDSSKKEGSEQCDFRSEIELLVNENITNIWSKEYCDGETDNLRKETSQMISANNAVSEKSIKVNNTTSVINHPLNLIFSRTCYKTDESSESTNSSLKNFDSERSFNYSPCDKVNKNIGMGDVHTTNTSEDVEYECNETESGKKCNYFDLYESINNSEVMSPLLLDYCKLIECLYNSPPSKCKSVILKNKSSFTSCCNPVPKQHIISKYSALEMKRKNSQNSRYSPLHNSRNENLHKETNDSKIDICACCMSKSNRNAGGRNTTLFTNYSPSVSTRSQCYCCNTCRHTELRLGGGDDFCVNLTKEK